MFCERKVTYFGRLKLEYFNEYSDLMFVELKKFLYLHPDLIKIEELMNINGLNLRERRKK